MTKNNSQFPTIVYGVVVYNASEGRKVCKKREAELKVARAAKEEAYQKEETERFMRKGFSESEARFLAMGNSPCNSVSTFV